MLENTFVVVLAGGDGRRLQEAARARYGYARPKQFCDFDGTGTLLDHTLARARRLVPNERILVVTSRAWRREADEVLRAWPGVAQVEQPRNLDTTPGLVLPTLRVLGIDPGASVVMLPSDHHVADDVAFTRSLAEAVIQSRGVPERLVLLGARPDRVEDGYGWIVPRRDGSGALAVGAFREKPPRAEVERLCAEGALINTFVMVGRARTLGGLFARHTPGWWRALGRAAGDPELMEAVYETLPASNFSRDVLEAAVSDLSVMPLRDSGWSDVGTVDRLRRALVDPMQASLAVAT